MFTFCGFGHDSVLSTLWLNKKEWKKQKRMKEKKEKSTLWPFTCVYRCVGKWRLCPWACHGGRIAGTVLISSKSVLENTVTIDRFSAIQRWNGTPGFGDETRSLERGRGYYSLPVLDLSSSKGHCFPVDPMVGGTICIVLLEVRSFISRRKVPSFDEFGYETP